MLFCLCVHFSGRRIILQSNEKSASYDMCKPIGFALKDSQSGLAFLLVRKYVS